MDLESLAQGIHMTQQLKLLRPGMLVTPKLYHHEGAVHIYDRPSRGNGSKTISPLVQDDLCFIVGIVQVNPMKDYDEDNGERNVLVLFEQRLGWICSGWLRPA